MKRRSVTTTRESGFTLVETGISIAILGFLLVIVSTSFITLVRQERAAVGLRDTVQSTRYGLNDISAAARSALSYTEIEPDSSNYGQLCLYQTSAIVQYFVATAPDGSGPGLFKVTIPLSQVSGMPNNGCNRIANYAIAATSYGTPTSLLSSGVNASAFRIWPPSSTSLVQLVTLRLGTSSTADSTLVNSDSTSATYGSCTSVNIGTCAASVIETSISLEGVKEQ